MGLFSGDRLAARKVLAVLGATDVGHLDYSFDRRRSF
jgi:hypothetical protein